MWDFNIRCLHHIKKKSKKNRPTDPPDFFHERANKKTKKCCLKLLFLHTVYYDTCVDLWKQKENLLKIGKPRKLKPAKKSPLLLYL